MASGSQSNSDDAIESIVEAIINRNAFIGSSRESLEDKLRSLDESQVRRLTEKKLVEGKLTVFGHVCVSIESNVFFSEGLSRLLFRIAGVDFSEVFQIEDCEYDIPLLHLAAYCGNKAAVQVLLGEEGIKFTAEDDKYSILHMAVKGQDPEIVRLVLSKAHSADPELFTYFLNSKDDLKMTALQHAAWEGCDNIIAELRKYDELDVSASGDHGFSALHLASWNGHVEVVKSLLEMKGRDIDLKKPSAKSLHWIGGASSKWIEKHQARIGNSEVKKLESLATKFHLQEIHLKSFSYRRQRILDREKAKQKQMSSLHEQCATELLVDFDLDFAKIKGLTTLHCAAYNGHATIVEILMEEISKGAQVKTTMNPLDELGLSPLHHAVICGEPATVEMLLSNSSVRGNVKDLRSKDLTPLNMAYLLKDVGLDSTPHGDQEWKRKKIIDLLLDQWDVKFYMDRLYKDRQLFVDAANAILVGAALIASITFAGWLQPPLNYQQYYGTDYLLGGAAPPDTYASYATVRQHVGVVIFWIFNSLSFFFAITTVLLGACVVLPMLGNEELERDVSRMRNVHIWTTLALNISVLFVIGAFIAAGFAVLPPTLKYQWSMIATTLLGGTVAFAALLYYSYRVYTLIRKIWGRQILQLRKDGLAKLQKELERWTTQKDNSTEGPPPRTQNLRFKFNVRRPNPPPGVKQLNASVWEFYSPSGNVEVDTGVDIIFFHGLQVNDDYENAYWRTWVAKDNDEVVWPKEWLSEYLPSARIFSVSYDVPVPRPFDYEFDENLVNDIILDPHLNIGQGRPVVLVGHCLGGIAIKQFLISAEREVYVSFIDRDRDRDRRRTFVDNVKGVFFYATPHDGSDLARFISRQKASSPILDLMKTIDQNKIQIGEKFKYMQHRRRELRTYALGECQPTSYLGFKDVIVPEASALRDVDVCYLHTTADHFSICKARSMDDPIVIIKLVSFGVELRSFS